MTRFLEPMKNEDWIRMVMKENDLPIHSGICFGIAMVGTHFMLANDVKKFDETLTHVFDLAYEDKATKLTKNDLVEVHNFLTAIYHYQHYLKHPLIRKKSGNSHSLATITQLYSPTLFKKSYSNNEKFKFIPIDNNTYKPDDLSGALTTLRALLVSTQTSIALLITSGKHAISVHYNSSDCKWELINSASLPSISFTNEAALVNKMSLIFKARNKPLDLTFKIRVVTPQKNYSEAASLIAEWSAGTRYALNPPCARPANC